jgi:hypothetical protein
MTWVAWPWRRSKRLRSLCTYQLPLAGVADSERGRGGSRCADAAAGEAAADALMQPQKSLVKFLWSASVPFNLQKRADALQVH